MRSSWDFHPVKFFEVQHYHAVLLVKHRLDLYLVLSELETFFYRLLHFAYLHFLRDGWDWRVQRGGPAQLWGWDGGGLGGRGLHNVPLISLPTAAFDKRNRCVNFWILKGDDESADIGDDPELEAIKVFSLKKTGIVKSTPSP